MSRLAKSAGLSTASGSEATTTGILRRGIASSLFPETRCEDPRVLECALPILRKRGAGGTLNSNFADPRLCFFSPFPSKIQTDPFFPSKKRQGTGNVSRNRFCARSPTPSNPEEADIAHSKSYLRRSSECIGATDPMSQNKETRRIFFLPPRWRRKVPSGVRESASVRFFVSVPPPPPTREAPQPRL